MANVGTVAPIAKLDTLTEELLFEVLDELATTRGLSSTAVGPSFAGWAKDKASVRRVSKYFDRKLREYGTLESSHATDDTLQFSNLNFRTTNPRHQQILARLDHVSSFVIPTGCIGYNHLSRGIESNTSWISSCDKTTRFLKDLEARLKDGSADISNLTDVYLEDRIGCGTAPPLQEISSHRFPTHLPPLTRAAGDMISVKDQQQSICLHVHPGDRSAWHYGFAWIPPDLEWSGDSRFDTPTFGSAWMPSRGRKHVYRFDVRGASVDPDDEGNVFARVDDFCARQVGVMDRTHLASTTILIPYLSLIDEQSLIARQPIDTGTHADEPLVISDRSDLAAIWTGLEGIVAKYADTTVEKADGKKDRLTLRAGGPVVCPYSVINPS